MLGRLGLVGLPEAVALCLNYPPAREGFNWVKDLP